MLEMRLDEVFQRWRVLAVTHRVLENVRATYERTRQPETLQEASIHLARLTQDRYVRVWTPLGESGLLVDDHAGRPLAVEVLSRGTREQLFLSLRLALASSLRLPRRPVAALARRRPAQLRRRASQSRGGGPARLRLRRAPTPRLHLPRAHREAVRVAENGSDPAPRECAGGRDRYRRIEAAEEANQGKSRPEPEPDPNHEVTEEEGADPIPRHSIPDERAAMTKSGVLRFRSLPRGKKMKMKPLANTGKTKRRRTGHRRNMTRTSRSSVVQTPMTPRRREVRSWLRTAATCHRFSNRLYRAPHQDRFHVRLLRRSWCSLLYRTQLPLFRLTRSQRRRWLRLLLRRCWLRVKRGCAIFSRVRYIELAARCALPV